MKHVFHHLRGVLIAFAALALSTGMVLGAQPEASLTGLANAASHAGKTVPVGQIEDTTEDEDTDEDVDEEVDEDVDEDVEEEGAEDGAGGENCATDPTTLTPDQLAELKHGSIVCWAAHQDEDVWPEWFTKHGEFVKCWAHHGKADAQDCTVDPDAEEPEEDAAATSTGHGKGQGKGKGHNK